MDIDLVDKIEADKLKSRLLNSFNDNLDDSGNFKILKVELVTCAWTLNLFCKNFGTALHKFEEGAKAGFKEGEKLGNGYRGGFNSRARTF